MKAIRMCINYRACYKIRSKGMYSWNVLAQVISVVFFAFRC